MSRYMVSILAGIVSLFVVQILVLVAYGQPVFCSCGYLSMWEGVVFSVGNSQQLTDWYTYSHIIHGFLFYWLLSVLFPKIPVSARLCMALGIEIGWELIENTPWVINQYRQQALAVGYVGDSVINSVSDSCAMMLGFFVAWRAPVWATVAAALFLEALVGYTIHDNLTLNVLNFVYQSDAITQWQNAI